MKILLDTHCWLWWLTIPERLGKKARSIIEDSDNDIFISIASAWEIAIKYSLGKLDLPEKPEKYVLSRLERCGFLTLKIELIHALKISELPHHRRDPFDRLMIAQSQVEKIPILTADKKFSPYKVKIIKAGK